MAAGERSEEDTRALKALMRQFGSTRYGSVPEATEASARFRAAVNAGEPTHVALGHALAFLEAVNGAVAAGLDQAQATASKLYSLEGDIAGMRRVLGL